MSAGLDQIQKPVSLALKNHGFRKFGRTYNLLRDDGIVHVVNFQSGQFPIGEYVIPGIRESFYGKFTVNLGVRLPCVAVAESLFKEKSHYQEYECHIRQRLGRLVDADDEGDAWWGIQSAPNSLGIDICNFLETFGLPFFDQFPSYLSVLEYYEKHLEFPYKNETRSTFDAAIIYAAIGNFERSEELFRSAKTSASEVGRKGTVEYFEKIETMVLAQQSPSTSLSSE